MTASELKENGGHISQIIQDAHELTRKIKIFKQEFDQAHTPHAKETNEPARTQT